MNAEILLPVAFGFSSLCFGGILFLMALVFVVRRNHGDVDSSDGCLVTFFSLLLAVAALTVLALAIFG